MRRKRVDRASEIPEKLRVFRWTEWADHPLDARHAWSRARMEHSKLHPEVWADGFSPFAGVANVRAKMAGRRPPYPDYDEGHPEFVG